jgi:septal ring factor EnvC (AmiA/AmiB activator)
MSPSSLESQIAEHPGTEQSEMHDHGTTGNLALSSSDFSALEERVARTVQLIKTERQARAAAEQRAESLDVQLSEQQTVVKSLQEEVRALNAERDQVRQRVDRLLSQLDALEV